MEKYRWMGKFAQNGRTRRPFIKTCQFGHSSSKLGVLPKKKLHPFTWCTKMQRKNLFRFHWTPVWISHINFTLKRQSTSNVEKVVKANFNLPLKCVGLLFWSWIYPKRKQMWTCGFLPAKRNKFFWINPLRANVGECIYNGTTTFRKVLLTSVKLPAWVRNFVVIFVGMTGCIWQIYGLFP